MNTKGLAGYNGITPSDIDNMSHEELKQAVKRLIQVSCVDCQDYLGDCLLPDTLADAFRDRL